MKRFVSLPRLLIGAAAVLALGLPLWFFALPDHDAVSEPPAQVLGRMTRPDEAPIGVKIGNQAPDFEVSTADGKRVRLSEFRGRPVVVNFWARWCSSCLKEMPEIAAELQKRGGSFVVLAVNAGETRAQALEFIDYIKAPFTFGLDPKLTVTDAYGVYGLPGTFFIDAGGIVRATYAGHAGEQRFGAYLDAAIEASTAPAFPVQLRPVSTIPRERVLTVIRRDDGLLFASRSLRCDYSYCPQAAIAALRSSEGVTRAAWVEDKDADGEPSLRVSFDSKWLSEDGLIERVATMLRETPDPLYQTELQIQRRP